MLGGTRGNTGTCADSCASGLAVERSWRILPLPGKSFSRSNEAGSRESISLLMGFLVVLAPERCTCFDCTGVMGLGLFDGYGSVGTILGDLDVGAFAMGLGAVGDRDISGVGVGLEAVGGVKTPAFCCCCIGYGSADCLLELAEGLSMRAVCSLEIAGCLPDKDGLVFPIEVSDATVGSSEPKCGIAICTAGTAVAASAIADACGVPDCCCVDQGKWVADAGVKGRRCPEPDCCVLRFLICEKPKSPASRMSAPVPVATGIATMLALIPPPCCD
jgi:hypothetical protein